MTIDDLEYGKEILKKIDDLKKTIENVKESDCYGEFYGVQREPKNRKAWQDFINAEVAVYQSELIGLESEFEMLGK